MNYEYLIAIGVIGFLYFVADKLTSILVALRNIEQNSSVIRMEVEGLAKRISDIEDILVSSHSRLIQIESVAGEYRNVYLRAPEFDPYTD